MQAQGPEFSLKNPYKERLEVMAYRHMLVTPGQADKDRQIPEVH